MAGGSPYRERQAPKQKPRSLTLYPAPWTLVLALGALFTVLALSVTTTPRWVQLKCEIVANKDLRCESSMRSIWGAGRPHRVFLPAPEVLASRPIFDSPLLASTLEAPPALALSVEYGGGSSTWIDARFGTGSRVRLTEEFAAGGNFELTEFFEFRSRVENGRSAELQFRSGFDNLMALLVLPWVWFMLWPAAARVHVLVDPAGGNVRITHRSRFWSKRTQRDVPLGSVTQVVVTGGDSMQGNAVYYPAFQLSDGKIVRLGDVASGSAERAEHHVKLLRAIIEEARAG
ncbi:MAG TPA: hypothetical protein PKD61_29445 [Polyangiaceae bacterium]|nr:hypothetical protein [Polyangiaceae bacterium]